MKKLRVQFNNEIVGPYSRSELKELIKKGYFPSFIKVSPVGDSKWYNLSELEGFSDLEIEERKDSSLIKKIKDMSPEKTPSSYQKVLKRKKNQINKEISTKKKKPIKEEPEDLDLNATLISKETYDYLEGTQKNVEENLNKRFTDLNEETRDDDKTQFYNLEEFKGALVEADETENELEKKEEEENKESQDFDEREDSNLNNNRKKIIYLVIVALIAVVFTMEEDGSSKKKIRSSFIRPNFSVPFIGEKRNQDKALSIFDEISKYNNYSFPDLLQRVVICLNSLEQAENQKVLEELLETYVLLLPFSEEDLAGAKVYKMFGLLKGYKDVKDPSVVNLKSRFFLNVSKPQASIYHLENYFKLNNKISSLMMATYLESLIKIGDFPKARTAIKKIYEMKNKGAYAYKSLLDFLKIENKFESYGKLFGEAYRKYPKSIQILLHGVDYFIIIKDYESAGKILEEIKDLNFENHELYYSQYLESMGVIMALKENYSIAKKYFEKAIQINPESEIVARLATLEKSERYSEISQLISKSKSINLMLKAKKYYKEKKWELALSNALNAVDVYPDYLPSKILLGEIQISQGYLKEAIHLLEKSGGKTADGLRAKMILLKAYAASYKFREGGVLISELNQTKVSEDDRYAEIVSYYYEKKEDYLRTILWLQKALKKNPLNESALYKLSKIYLDNNQFDRSKKLISRAMKLNPVDISYRILYANILYELEGVDTATGYLRKVLKEFPANSKIENQIAIYYYRSGKISDFENLVGKIKEKKLQDSDLFLFLMKAAQIEQKYDQVIKNAEEYLSINTFDHEIRLLLAKTYFDLGKFEEAKSVLQEIEEKVDSYPRLYFMLSKIALLEGNKEQAIQYAQKEIKQNPYAPYGFIQMGNIHKDDGEYTEAEAYYKKAQRLAPNDIELLKGLAKVKLQKNQHEAALDLYKKIRDTSGQVDPDVHFYIGESYRQLGRTKMASESYKTYLELYPESPIRSKIESYIESLK